MPPARKPPPAAAEISPAPPAAEGETPAETPEAGVRAAEEGHGGKEMEVEPAVEERDAVEHEEEPDEEAAGEDPEEAQEGADEGDGNEGEAVLAVGAGDGTAAAAETEKVVIKEGGDEKTAAKKGGPEEAVEEDEEPEEAEEEPEEAEEGAKEDQGMEEEATNVSAEFRPTVDDMNEIPEEEPEESGDEGSHGDNNKDESADQLSDGGDAGGCENGYAQNDEFDPSSLALDPISEGNDKDLEIFVGGLPKDCVEEDITMVFSQFGDIESIRIIKNQATKKIRGIAFVRYANTEAAKKALAEFKEGIEVKGKKVRVSTSQDNNTLYIGNICKSWTKDQVLNTLKSIGIEAFEMSLPDDPDTGGKNRGFAYLKFATHDNAKAAFQRLKRPDAIFGIDRSAKVSFARHPTESSEELLMKVKTVYLEHFPLSWDESKIKECCEGYGKIQKVHLFQKSKKSKKKKFSFVEFSSRKSALACVEGINNTKIGGEVKLVASLARLPCKIQLAEKSAKGGFKVNSGATSKDADKSKKKRDQKREVVVKNLPHKLPKGDKSNLTSQGDAEVPQTSNRSKGKRKAEKSKNTSVNDRPSKKARKNRDVLRRPSNTTHLGSPARTAYAGQLAGNIMHPAGPRYATGYQAYPSVGATSRSKPNARDLEPHAGYIPLENRAPSNRFPSSHLQSTYVYDEQRTAPYNIHQINGLPYTRETAAPQPAYSVYTSNPGYQGGYAYTNLPPLPPAPGGSYHPGSGAYIPRRGYY